MFREPWQDILVSLLWDDRDDDYTAIHIRADGGEIHVQMTRMSDGKFLFSIETPKVGTKNWLSFYVPFEDADVRNVNDVIMFINKHWDEYMLTFSSYQEALASK